MTLPEHVTRAVIAKVKESEFSSPVCEEMTTLLTLQIVSERIALHYIKHLKDDKIARADRYETLREFSENSVYHDESFVGSLIADSFKDAVKQVKSSKEFKYVVVRQSTDQKDGAEQGFNWYGLVKDIFAMKPINLMILIVATIFCGLYVSGEMSLSDIKEIIRMFVKSEQNSLDVGSGAVSAR